MLIIIISIVYQIRVFASVRPETMIKFVLNIWQHSSDRFIAMQTI